jgi:1-acyl-sn-glycerol-3-phosphate acyltransferase
MIVCCTQVSAAENMRFPIMGEIMLAFQTIFVDRDSQASGRGAAQLIATTLEDKRFPQVSGRRLLSASRVAYILLARQLHC